MHVQLFKMDNNEKPVWTIAQASDAITMNQKLGKTKKWNVLVHIEYGSVHLISNFGQSNASELNLPCIYIRCNQV